MVNEYITFMRTLLGTLFFLAAAPAPAAEPCTFNPGDHVCIIGNGTADRMQHDGWLETFIHASLPKHNLVFRNLGFAGDELTIRLRSESFGSPDYWLTKCKADVIFAFFGFNESFAGEAGLPKFKKDLEDFITHTLAQKYNGKSPPRLVLFSPIAHEDLKNPHLPDGKENNKRLAMYTAATAEVAKARNVYFVDLFRRSTSLYLEGKNYTIDGIHLADNGDREIAKLICAQLFVFPEFSLGTEIRRDPQDPIRFLATAVNDKNDVWFRRYRTTDGYSIFGGRADLKFVDGQTNRVVAQREMEVLDVMTENRDKRIWAIASS